MHIYPFSLTELDSNRELRCASTHRDAVDLDVPVERGPEVIVPVLVGAGPRNDARIHEGRHREVHQHEQGQDP
jgi:hypothetical protein